MKGYIYQDYSMADRIKMLSNLAEKRETQTYNRSLSDIEVDLEKDKYSRDAIELARQKAEMKATAERLKAGVTSIENLMEERLERIKTGQMQTTAMLFGIADFSKQRMNFYDGYGEQIFDRPLTPDEKQGKLFIELKTDSEEITDVEFEEQVSEMYGDEKQQPEEAGNVNIEVTDPTEDKPKKKAPKGGKKSSPDQDDQNNPI